MRLTFRYYDYLGGSLLSDKVKKVRFSGRENMDKKSTISDIAKELGVSNALVSIVLNGKNKEMRISDKMTSKVLKLAKLMNYTPNYHAKGLRSGKSNTIGLIVGDIANPFFGKLARNIGNNALNRGYTVFIGNSDENKSKFAIQLEIFTNRHVDGIILVPPIGSEKELLSLKKRKIPFVVLDRILTEVSSHVVTINNYTASYDATERLIKNNRKNISLINTNFKLVNMHQREKGFIDALENNGVALNKSLIKHIRYNHEKSDILSEIQDIVKNKADAVLFATSYLGVLGVESLLDLGVKIPQNMSIIGFDDNLAYRTARTKITAVLQPLERMSQEAVRILIDSVEGKYNEGQYEKIELDVEYIYRESCK